MTSRQAAMSSGQAPANAKACALTSNPDHCATFHADTEDYWLSWADGCTHVGDYHDEIHSSLLVLKALTYRPTGGIVAAPTTSLPECIEKRRE